MKRYLFLIAVVFTSLETVGQVKPPIDTANYLQKIDPTLVRTDTNATNLLTYNTTSHMAEPMSGVTLTAYFRKGMVNNARFLADSTRLAAEIARATAAEALKANISSLSTVATSGSYNDLSNKPTIPAAQVNSDWSAVSGVSQILNKPTIPSALTAGSNISIVANSINNTSPDQVVSLTPSGYYVKSVTGTYPNFTIVSNPITINNTPTITNTTSGIVSSTYNSRVKYTFSLSTSLTLVNLASSAEVYLEISPNGSTWTRVDGGKLSKTVTVGLVATDAIFYNVSAEVPATYYRRIVAVVSGGGVVTYMYGQEVNY